MGDSNNVTRLYAWWCKDNVEHAKVFYSTKELVQHMVDNGIRCYAYKLMKHGRGCIEY